MHIVWVGLGNCVQDWPLCRVSLNLSHPGVSWKVNQYDCACVHIRSKVKAMNLITVQPGIKRSRDFYPVLHMCSKGLSDYSWTGVYSI